MIDKIKHFQICFAIFAFTSSCDNSTEFKNITVTKELLQGKWVLDSSSIKDCSTKEELFLVHDKMYRCSYWRDDYFIDSAKLNHSTIYSNANNDYSLAMIDSNNLVIRNHDIFYYERVRENDFMLELNNYRLGNQLKKRYVGYWKPINAPTEPIKIMNQIPLCNSISFKLFNNGTAEFYINQHIDSIIRHFFLVRGNSPQFRNGCLVGDYGMTWNDSRQQIGMVFSPYKTDTIWFEKGIK